MSGSKSMFRNLISKLTHQTIFVDKLTYIHTYIRAENYVKVCKKKIDQTMTPWLWVQLWMLYLTPTVPCNIITNYYWAGQE